MSASLLRYQEGGVTVTLDAGALRDAVEAAVQAAGGAVVSEMRATVDPIVAAARRDWYGPRGVTRRTGRSGDLRTVTTVTPDEVRVGIGSTDDRVVGGRFVALYVHRPGRLSLAKQLVSRGEWWAWRNSGKPVGKAGKGEDDWTIYVPNPKASDGANLMSELVRKPMQAQIRRLPDALREAILRRVPR